MRASVAFLDPLSFDTPTEADLRPLSRDLGLGRVVDWLLALILLVFVSVIESGKLACNGRSASHGGGRRSMRVTRFAAQYMSHSAPAKRWRCRNFQWRTLTGPRHVSPPHDTESAVSLRRSWSSLLSRAYERESTISSFVIAAHCPELPYRHAPRPPRSREELWKARPVACSASR